MLTPEQKHQLLTAANEVVDFQRKDIDSAEMLFAVVERFMESQPRPEPVSFEFLDSNERFTQPLYAWPPITAVQTTT